MFDTAEEYSKGKSEEEMYVTKKDLIIHDSNLSPTGDEPSRN